MTFERIREGNSRYQLRYAAGLYWLLDMEQEGLPCKKPLAINSVGAHIWRLIEKGEKPEDIAGKLSEEYQVAREVIQDDIASFLKQLEEYGIM